MLSSAMSKPKNKKISFNTEFAKEYKTSNTGAYASTCDILSLQHSLSTF